MSTVIIDEARWCPGTEHGDGRRCRYVTSGDGARIHVVEAGDPTATRGVVFVHGYMQTHVVFDEQLGRPDELPGWRLVGFDLRGHGWSEPKPADYDDPQVWADDLQAVVDGCGLTEVVVVAASYGGFVVGDYLACGGRPKAVVLVAAGSHTEPSDASAREEDEFLSLLPALCSDVHDTQHAATRRFVSLLTHVPLSVSATVRLEGGAARAGVDARRALAARSHDVRPTFQNADMPLLFMHGTEDRLQPPAASEGLADQCSSELKLLPQTGHMPFLEQPTVFNHALRGFLVSIDLSVDLLS